MDPYYNKASGPIPGMLVLLNGKLFTEIAAGNQAITRIDDIVLTEPGIYRFSRQSLDGTISGGSNPSGFSKTLPTGSIGGHARTQRFRRGAGNCRRIFPLWAG